MNKLWMIAIFCTLLSACASYDPIMDTSGRSGTFQTSKAEETTNDQQHCKLLAKENSSFFGNIISWIESPEAETQQTSIHRKCLTNRGHSVLN